MKRKLFALFLFYHLKNITYSLFAGMVVPLMVEEFLAPFTLLCIWFSLHCSVCCLFVVVYPLVFLGCGGAYILLLLSLSFSFFSVETDAMSQTPFHCILSSFPEDRWWMGVLLLFCAPKSSLQILFQDLFSLGSLGTFGLKNQFCSLYSISRICFG